MAIKKLDFKFQNELRRNQHIRELADKVNEIIDDSNPLIDNIEYDTTNNVIKVKKDLSMNGNDIDVENMNLYGTLNLVNQTNQSVKKIYCHQVQYNITNGSILLTLVFNNSATQFTASTFIDWIDALYAERQGTVRVLTTGGIISGTAIYPVAFLGRRATSPLYRLYSRNSSGENVLIDFTDKETFLASIDTFNDEIYAIN